MKMHRLIRQTCEIAAEDIGRQKADRIAEAAQKRYEELCRENASDSKALRAHTYKRILHGIRQVDCDKKPYAFLLQRTPCSLHQSSAM